MTTSPSFQSSRYRTPYWAGNRQLFVVEPGIVCIIAMTTLATENFVLCVIAMQQTKKISRNCVSTKITGVVKDYHHLAEATLWPCLVERPI